MTRRCTIFIAALAVILLTAGCKAPISESSVPPVPPQPQSTPSPSSPPSSAAESHIPVSNDIPASFMGKTFGDVIATYGEDYTFDEMNSMFISFKLAGDVELTFHCSQPSVWGVFDPDDIVTYISVSGPKGQPVTDWLSIGMTQGEIEAAMPPIKVPEEAKADPDRPNEYYWNGDINGTFTRFFLMLDETGSLLYANIKGEELMTQLAAQ